MLHIHRDTCNAFTMIQAIHKESFNFFKSTGRLNENGPIENNSEPFVVIMSDKGKENNRRFEGSEK